MEFNQTELKELNVALQKAFGDMQKGVDKSQEIAEQATAEVKKYGTLTGETNAKLGEIGGEMKKLSDALADVKARTLDIEQKGAHRPGGLEQTKSAGAIFADSQELKDMVDRGMQGSKAVNVGSIRSKAAIVNAIGSN